MKQFASIIVDVHHSNVDHIYDYSVPEGMQVDVGSIVVVPFGRGNRPVDGYVVEMTDAYEADNIKEIARVKDAADALLPEQVLLARQMKERYTCLLSQSLSLMLPKAAMKEKVQHKTIRVAKPSVTDEEKDSVLEQLKRAKAQHETMQLLLELKEAAVADLEKIRPGAAQAVKKLSEKGYVCIEEVTVNRNPYQEISTQKGAGNVHLTKGQQQVLEEIYTALDKRQGHFLLHGVTGSGKTEIYLRAIDKCLNEGRGAIMLVPEISLTPLMVQRFRNAFGGRIAVLHSKLSQGERYDEWCRIKRGEADVVVGARSAIFAPIRNLGIIVIDEEHEQAYKSESTPRYSAEEVAVFRCKNEGAVLLLGSATPAIATFYKAVQQKYRILELPQRINEGPLPKVELIDMRKEVAKGNRTVFSVALYGRLKEVLDKGQQAILFINRRGYSNFVMCRGCGLVFKCNNCDVSLTYHKRTGKLHCHYCESIWNMPETCPSCGKKYLKHFGVATEQVEEQFKQLFPGVGVLRMDFDTTRGKDSHYKILHAFEKQEAQVLIGTQMVAKGHDFPMVTLVGIMAADASLFLPDYRSAERTFQLITQVSGRAGRDAHTGHVIAQTYTPSHPVLRMAAQHDYQAFYQYEIASRQSAMFPPFGCFVRIVFFGQDAVLVKEECEAFSARVKKYFELRLKNRYNDNIITYACAPAPISMIKGQYRYHIIVKTKWDDEMRDILHGLTEHVNKYNKRDISASMEINPLNMF
ncbi:primosomal protein N' [Clostridia bacterium OttesenSCG-928-F22]|nr:primosomal protein N' [Clostridia bacterium OttesenSCG-928-F22]